MVGSRNRRHIGPIGVVAGRFSRPRRHHIGGKKALKNMSPKGTGP